MSDTTKLKLTPQQEAVVLNRGGDLLVSAAAGSGKTKVLVDRIMSRICDDGADITELVVITFTKAAASELRSKIIDALAHRLAADPGNRHIQRQMRLIYAASISTVHSFCGTLLRSNAAIAGLPSDFRIGEEQECRVLRAAAMEDLLESMYKNIDRRPDVRAFVEELAYGRDDAAVPAILFDIYETVQSHPWPAKWAAQCMASMDVSRYSDAAETPWGRYIVNNIKEHVNSQVSLVDEALSICDADSALSDAFRDALCRDRARMEALLACTKWDELRMALEDKGLKWGRQKPIKKGAPYSELAKERISSLRNRYKKSVDSKSKGVYGLSAEILSDLQKTEASVRGMFELVADFAERYRAKKEAHNILDFSDLEHETIRLLIDEETETRTELADSVAMKYKEIMVDEYQDTNSVQETIFKAISHNNLCMVGDVKQSIYGFRQADPSIFMAHYSSFGSHESAGDGQPRKIILSRNFRSRPEILSATNDVMRMCMSPSVGGIEYGEAEALIPGRTDFIPLADPVVELVTIDMAIEADEESAVDEDDGIEVAAKADVEARYVARRISDMIGTDYIVDEGTGEPRPIRASDIAILMRSTKNSAKHYVKALSELGIASTSTKSESIMDTTEVATLYAYLQIIDNPTQDIPLVAVMASPLVGFTADKLARVRMAKKDARTFYDALLAYDADARGADSIAHAFIVQLAELRKKAPHTKLSKLFDAVVVATDADDVFGSMPNGDLRMANIQKFREMIAGFENGGANGLFSFLVHIEALRAQGAEMPQASAVLADDAVTILSTHSSKGLEFPVVFLADLSRRFNTSDMKASALLHREFGAGVQVTDRALNYRYPTIARAAVSMASAAETKGEELRILYVAMTRAKQRLIMTYCDKMGKTMSRLSTHAEAPLPPHVAQGVTNPGEWVLLTAMMRPEGAALAVMGGHLPHCLGAESPTWHIECVSATDVGGVRRSMEELEAAEGICTTGDIALPGDAQYEPLDTEQMLRDMEYVYPHTAATHTQSKVVASALHSQVKVTISRPDFAKREGFTAAERGTATHTFMRYANYTKCVAEGKAGIKAEIERIVASRYISEQDADAILVKALSTLFQSAAGRELAELQGNAKQEFPFTLLVPAQTILPKGDTPVPDDDVVVQGIIDFHVVLDKGIVLYDFKTDYVDGPDDEAEKAASYKHQMDVYTMALKEIYHLPVTRREVLFLRTGRGVLV